MESGMMITRSRCDIKKYRKSKEEADLVKQAILIRNKMKKAWEQSKWHPVGITTQPDFFYEEPAPETPRWTARGHSTINDQQVEPQVPPQTEQNYPTPLETPKSPPAPHP